MGVGGKIKNFARKPEITRRAVCLAEVIDQSRMLVETRRKKLGVRLEVEAIPTDWQVLAEAQQLIKMCNDKLQQVETDVKQILNNEQE